MNIQLPQKASARLKLCRARPKKLIKLFKSTAHERVKRGERNLLPQIFNQTAPVCVVACANYFCEEGNASSWGGEERLCKRAALLADEIFSPTHERVDARVTQSAQGIVLIAHKRLLFALSFFTRASRIMLFYDSLIKCRVL